MGPEGGGVAGGTRDLRMEMNSALGVVVTGDDLGMVVREGAMTVFVRWYGERGGEGEIVVRDRHVDLWKSQERRSHLPSLVPPTAYNKSIAVLDAAAFPCTMIYTIHERHIHTIDPIRIFLGQWP